MSIETELFPHLAAIGRLHAFAYDAPFIDIGIPEDYARAQDFIPAVLTRPALFLDRDGVINTDIGHLHRIEDFTWIEGARETIKRACDLGYHVFVVTNQGGVARGLYDEDQVRLLHRWIAERVFDLGAYISDFRYCPHNPEGSRAEYAVACSWRKPGPGMILDLMAHHGIDRENSLMVGDRDTDMQAAQAAGLRGVLFRGGNLYDLVAPCLSRRERTP